MKNQKQKKNFKKKKQNKIIVSQNCFYLGRETQTFFLVSYKRKEKPTNLKISQFKQTHTQLLFKPLFAKKKLEVN